MVFSIGAMRSTFIVLDLLSQQFWGYTGHILGVSDYRDKIQWGVDDFLMGCMGYNSSHSATSHLDFMKGCGLELGMRAEHGPT